MPQERKLLVLLTTYSRGDNLPNIVESVVNQTYKDYKIFISDDCSPNNPEKIVKKIIENTPPPVISNITGIIRI